MKTILPALAIAFSLACISSSANAENPLHDGRQLRAFLWKLWYFEVVDIEITLSSDQSYPERIRYFNLRGISPSGDNYVMTSPEMVSMTTNWNIKFGADGNGPASWNIPQDIAKCCFLLIPQKNAARIEFGRRIMDYESIEYSAWQEGNLEFAQAKGSYYFVNKLSGEKSLHEFRILVERNPASGGWFLSTYRGEESFYDKSDTFELFQALLQLD